MTLVKKFIDFAEQTYSIDWTAIQQVVESRLKLTPTADRSLYDPQQYPSYWWVPILVGSYVAASWETILADTEAFLGACIMRHCLFDDPRPFDVAGSDDFGAIVDAYDGCRIGAEDASSFEARFTAKCLPWKVVLAIGTCGISAEICVWEDYVTAMKAIVRVHSCLQMIDDWHDKGEDLARAHWNMWIHEPARATLSVIEPLLEGSRISVEELRPHFLRRALAAQLDDTAEELRQIVSGSLWELGEALVEARPLHLNTWIPHIEAEQMGQRHDSSLDDEITAGIAFLSRSATAEGGGLWRDFALPGVTAGSTECVSAFIAAQIGAIPEGRALAASVVSRIASRVRQTGGWGYREDVPEDCDSTAWMSLGAAAAGVDLPRPVVERSMRFITSHQRANGGFATYGPAAKDRLTPSDQAGWFEPEVSVTASAVLALAATGLVSAERLRGAYLYLLGSCRDGVWDSYWWNGFGYPTYHSLLALSTEGGTLYRTQLSASEQAILLRCCVGGGWANERGMAANGFSTSFAVRALLLGEPQRAAREAVEGAISYLCGLMTSTGAVPPSAEMLAPGGVRGRDLMLRDNGNVTTACVIRALHEVRKCLR